jgi:hypothetical protein
MANELQQLPNPTNIPEAVSTGYQRQNTNMFAIQTGLDTTEPLDDGNVTITIPGGGLVEVNGVLFKVTNTVTIAKPYSDIAQWVAVKDNGNGNASFSLVFRPGIWNPSKKGCYLPDGSRTLNWVSLGIPNNRTETNRAYSRTTKGEDTIKLKFGVGWYRATLLSGLGNGPGQNGVGGTLGSGGPGGNGGVAIDDDIVHVIFFNDGKNITIKVGGSGGSGGKGGNGGSQSGSGGGGAGGGGSGSGEATEIVGIAKTKSVKAGQGGDGGTSYDGTSRAGGGGGSPGGVGYDDGGMKGGTGGIISSSNTAIHGGGGKYGAGGGGNGSLGGSAGGGGQGLNGEDQPDGYSSAGYCNIYKLEN